MKVFTVDVCLINLDRCSSETDIQSHITSLNIVTKRCMPAAVGCPEQQTCEGKRT